MRAGPSSTTASDVILQPMMPRHLALRPVMSSSAVFSNR
jgi:hypothetical protein